MIKSVLWSSMIDYPDNICSVIFTSGCNFDCEFCYNKKLTFEKEINFEKEIFLKLLARKSFINHIIISGGECTISPDFLNIVDMLYENDFRIGIHTNGYRPDIIKHVINKLDFIGMDIKNDFQNYSKISRSRSRCGKNKKID